MSFGAFKTAGASPRPTGDGSSRAPTPTAFPGEATSNATLCGAYLEFCVMQNISNRRKTIYRLVILSIYIPCGIFEIQPLRAVRDVRQRRTSLTHSICLLAQTRRIVRPLKSLCDLTGGEQGVWGGRGVCRALRGGDPQRMSRKRLLFIFYCIRSSKGRSCTRRRRVTLISFCSLSG